MGSVWFLGFYFLLATLSSSTDAFQEKESVDLSGLQLSLYHVKSNASLTPKALFDDVLSNDRERVKALYSRLAQNEPNITTTSSSIDSPKPSELKSVSIPLNPGVSIGTGNYYVKVGLGSPAKYYAMIIDTGSSFSWLQCQPCKIYCHNQADPIFDPKTSKSYKSLSCRSAECLSLKRATLNDPFCEATSNACVYTASYGDASFSIGYLSQERLILTPSQILTRFVYGCGQENQGLFGMAAGMLGLARDKLSLLGQVSFQYGYAFSYCLPSARGQGGILSIGTTSLGNAAAYKFTPMIVNPKNPSLYFLRLAAITVAGKPLVASAASYRVSTIIDSGTVITRFPRLLYAPLRDAFAKIMSTKFAKAPSFSILDTCFKANLGGAAAAPQIRLVFQGGAELTLGARNTLIEADKGVVCLAFAEGNEIAIIGNHQQQTFKVAYDVSKSRIGFAPGGCS